MTDTAHTPGPWEVAYLDHAEQRVVRAEHYEVCTCWHHSVGSIEKEMEANARLIAAAPELMEALKEVMSWTRNWDVQFLEDDEWPETEEKVRAAIAKAEGRS